MEARELRIGNLVGFYRSGISEMLIGTIAEIALQENSSEYHYTIPEFNPNVPISGKALKGIHLSEERILQFGFERNLSWKNIFHLKKYRIVLRTNGFILYQGGIKLCKLEFVHDLQNIYFALTNTELTIKQTTDAKV